jgi:hypothetical protein
LRSTAIAIVATVFHRLLFICVTLEVGTFNVASSSDDQSSVLLDVAAQYVDMTSCNVFHGSTETLVTAKDDARRIASFDGNVVSVHDQRAERAALRAKLLKSHIAHIIVGLEDMESLAFYADNDSLRLANLNQVIQLVVSKAQTTGGDFSGLLNLRCQHFKLKIGGFR